MRTVRPLFVLQVCALDWRDGAYPAFADGGPGPLAGAAGTFGLIVASECVYDEDMAKPLLRTVHRASVSWFKMRLDLWVDSAPQAQLPLPGAQGLPTQPRAPRQQLRSLVGYHGALVVARSKRVSPL